MDELLTLMSCDGVRAGRTDTSVWVELLPRGDQESFVGVLGLLGLMGRTDYEVSYDPTTGAETFHFKEDAVGG